MTNKKGSSKESKQSRWTKAAIRFLSKARDLYVRGMTEFSTHFAHAEAAICCPAGQLSTPPKSFSVASTRTRSSASDDDFKELVRAASFRRSHGKRVELDLDLQMGVPARSHGVKGGIGRIDEDKPCDFGDHIIDLKPDIYPRSKSYGVHGRGTGVF